MKIENSILKKAIFGAVRFEEENGILKMSRFSDRQKKYFIEHLDSINKPLKEPASANMSLDFYTDSTTFTFEADCVKASGQAICWFDLYIDGTLKEHFGYTDKETRHVSISTALKSGKKRITLYFPCLFNTQITNVQLDDEALFEPIKKDRKILFFGDSITQGYISEFPSVTYTAIVARELNAECVNQGIGGAVFDETDLDGELPFEPDTVFVAYGTNDWTKKRDFSVHAVNYLNKLTSIYKDAVIYVILPIWRGNIEERIKTNGITQSFEEMHEELADICKNYSNVTVIDGMELVPHYLNMFCEDTVHPNELGFVFYGNELLKHIK